MPPTGAGATRGCSVDTPLTRTTPPSWLTRLVDMVAARAGSSQGPGRARPSAALDLERQGCRKIPALVDPDVVEAEPARHLAQLGGQLLGGLRRRVLLGERRAHQQCTGLPVRLE